MVASSVEITKEGADVDLAALRTQVRALAAQGYGSLKFAMSGFEGDAPGGSRALIYSQAEASTIGDVARETGVSLACHAIADESVKRALRGGFRVLYHCTYAGEETLDDMEAQKAEIFCAPAAGLLYSRVHGSLEPEKNRAEAERFKAFSARELDAMTRLIPEMKRRGIRVLPGGDYGFAHHPIGRNALDVQLFVDLFGYSPAEALHAATKMGGQLMNLPVGEVKVGMLADLLLVKGDPTKDVSILQDKTNLLSIMKGGRFYKLSSTLCGHHNSGAAP